MMPMCCSCNGKVGFGQDVKGHPICYACLRKVSLLAMDSLCHIRDAIKAADSGDLTEMEAGTLWETEKTLFLINVEMNIRAYKTPFIEVPPPGDPSFGDTGSGA